MIRLSAHLSVQFAHLPYPERPVAAAAAGFELVETWWPGTDADAWAEAVAAAGLGVACLNAFGGDLAAGERGFLNVEERREQTLAEIAAAVELARRLGCPCVNVLPGRLLPGVPAAQQWHAAVETLREAAVLDVTLLVEALNAHDVPGSLLPTPRRAAELVDAVGHPGVRLLYDAYHAAMAGSDPVREVGSLASLLGHVQYADSPGRGAPATGTVDFQAFVAALASAGYDGALGLEYPTERMAAVA
jgi:hydroxypyruvate isomerase